jgi:hypothetical protein
VSVAPVVAACIKTSAAACVSSILSVFSPGDPNALTGPSGVGGQSWVAGSQALTYGITFSNDPTATAPAQLVVVTEPLGANVNISTLSLPSITIPNGISNVQVPVPPGSFNPAAGVNEFTTNVDLRPAQSLFVNVDALLNTTTQTLTWTFTSIDPTTGMPPLNPLVGFLPAGAGASVSFSLSPSPGVPTGNTVTEQAGVSFNGGTPTNTQPWVNTIDNTPPLSEVTALPSTSTCPDFRVSWSGSDVGSGLKGFVVFVSDTGGPFTRWISTNRTSAIYQGAEGHSYRFFSLAEDLVGNIQLSKTIKEASTSVKAAGPCGPPSLYGVMTKVSQSGTTVTADLILANIGFTAAQVVDINEITCQTLSGSGTVTLSSPTLPNDLSLLGVAATTTVPLTLNVPATVTELSVIERGMLQDSAGNSYKFALKQTVTP